VVQAFYVPNFVCNRRVHLFVLLDFIWFASHLHLSLVTCTVAVFNEVTVSEFDLTKIDMQ